MLSELHIVPQIFFTTREKFHPGSPSSNPVESITGSDRSNVEDFSYFLPHFVTEADDEVNTNGQQEQVDRSFQGIDLSESAGQVTISLVPVGRQENAAGAIQVSFNPGDHCNFGDGYGCTYAFSSSKGSEIDFVSLHSGIGGEADALRNLIEGTGFNRGLYTANEVHDRINTLQGSSISLIQGGREIEGIQVLAIIRIPPAIVHEYRSLPVEQTLGFAVEMAGLDSGILEDDLLVLETCGWRLPDDEYVEGLDDLTYSVYLVFMGLAEH